MKYRPKFNDGRKSDTAPLKEVIGELLRSYRIDEQFNKTKIVAFWEKFMGKTIANRTNKIFFKDKTMFIEISSAPLKNELALSKSKMLELIDKEFGKGIVKDIVFL